MNIEKIISEMTLKEKCALLVGADSWHTTAIPRLGVPSIMMADGPHGLRKQLDSSNSIEAQESYKAVCFPAEATIAASFDPELAYRMGEGIAEECLNKDVHALLGPGLNIKRSPLCGRNFEYYSEDPLLAGEMGAAFVRGIQSKNVGACIKHFALNSQESYRMTSDSVADERAFYEIYTKAFHRAVRENPAMVMCSYNKIDGIYTSQNQRLLRDVLRREFGYEGLIVSDWTAVDDRTEALKATLDLEMPGYIYSVHRLEKDFKAGKITMDDLDASVRRILKLVDSKAMNHIQDFDLSDNHRLARTIAEGSLVLLKNERKILPIRPGEKIALLGALARHVRYQGGGSSHINPFKVDSLLDFIPEETECAFAEGYVLTGDGYDQALLDEAKRLAAGKDKAIVVIGLTDAYESEGFDRRHLDLPRGHNALVEAVRSVNENVIVVLQLGSPVLMPWNDDVPAILNAYLLGEAGAGALADILFGKVNPSGHLPESFPATLEDTPCYGHFALGNGEIPYRESLYVGYRYYSSKGRKTLYPFGHGLSYTEFAISNLHVDSEVLTVSGTITVSVDVQNVGDVPGKEVVQLYVENNQDRQFKAVHELRKFQKISLEPGETKTVVFSLTEADFSYYEPAIRGFATDPGNYRIQIRKNAETLILEAPLRIVNENHKTYAMNFMKASSYRLGGGLRFTAEDFESLIGRNVGPGHVKSRRPFTINSNFEDLSATKLGAFLAKKAIELGASQVKDAEETYRRMVEQSLLETPLRSTVLFSGGLVKMHQMQAAVELCNGRFFKALGCLFRRD